MKAKSFLGSRGALWALVAVVALSLCMIAGCTSSSSSSAASASGSAASASASATSASASTSAASASAASASAASASASASASSEAATHIVVDGGGREVEIPTRANLKRMYAANPIAQMFILTLDPDLLAGSNSDYSDAELKYMPGNLKDAPNYGTQAAGGTLDLEAIMKAEVQVILNVTSGGMTQDAIDAANDLQEQTGIPVLVFDGDVAITPDTYRAIGKVLDMEDRAEELAQYCDKAYKDVQEAIAKVPEDQRIGVYYAEGPKGLKTEPANSPHFTTFKVGGAKNVADCELTKGAGMTEVSLENVITWNPDVIIAWSSEYRGGSDELIRTSSDWESIAAVQNGKVYTIPCLPFTWGDRPPSVTRYIGMQWMANLLYPDVYNVDMVQVTKEYYKLFFSADLTDEEAKEILFLS